MSDAFLHYLSHNKYEQDQSLFFLHVQLKGCLRYLRRGVGGLSEGLDPQSCLPHRPGFSPVCPDACILPAGVRARSQMVCEAGNRGTSASQAICIHAAFLGLIWSCKSSSHCSSDGAWPVPPLKGIAITEQIVPYCQQLSGYLGNVFCFGITSLSIMLKEGSAFFFSFSFLLYLCFWLCFSDAG